MKSRSLRLAGLIWAAGPLDGCSGGGSSSPAPATPAIARAIPAAITYGTGLSATQLDASANYPGTFT